MSEGVLLAPAAFAVVIAAIVVFGPRRGRMLPAEKAATYRFFWNLVSVVAIGSVSVYMQRWLTAHFGLSYWASLGVMLGLAIVVGLLAQGVRLMTNRGEVRDGR
jgi:hypothetical protein